MICVTIFMVEDRKIVNSKTLTFFAFRTTVHCECVCSAQRVNQTTAPRHVSDVTST